MKQFIRTTTQLSLRIFLIVGLLAGALAVSGAQSAHAWGATIVVDDFNSGAFTSSTLIDDLAATGAIGGARDILVQDSGGGSVSSVMSLTPGNGYLNLAVGDSPGTYQIGWGTMIFSNDSELNLNASGLDRIVVTLSEAPSSGIITVITEKADMFAGMTLTSSLPLSGPGDYTFMFSSFGLLDPSDIDGIEIVLTQGVSASSTVRFESIVIGQAGCPAGQYDNGNGCLVDDFNSGAFSIDGPSGYFIDLPAPGAIDGARDVLVQDSTPALTPSIMSLTPGDGYLNLAVGSLPGNYQIGWGTLFFSGGAELNLDASRYDRVVVTLSQAPSSGMITVITEKVDMFMFPDRTLTSSLPLSGAGDYTFMFSSGFCWDINSPNRCDVDGIQIVLDQGVSAFSTVRFESIVIGSAGVLGPAPCPAGQYDNGSGCVNADPGYYVPMSGATEQTPCAPGTYQPNAGSVSCILADAGHYVDVTGAAMQIDCLPGYYQPNAGATSCFAADPGYFVSTTGAIISMPCAAGRYQPNAGSTSCLLADPGYYVPVSGGIAQLACPSGTTSSAGAIACTSVAYNFSGFFQPVDNLPALNQVKAGQGIPVKFSLSGNQGLGILASGSPASMQIACDGSAPVDAIETVTAGNSGLSYDAASDTYTYVWKTNKSWAGTCRQLQVRLTDGTVHVANFKFK